MSASNQSKPNAHINDKIFDKINNLQEICQKNMTNCDSIKCIPQSAMYNQFPQCIDEIDEKQDLSIMQYSQHRTQV